MPTIVETTPQFGRDLKGLVKRYPSVLDAVEAVEQTLQNDERPGAQVPGFSGEVYKVRLPNRSGRRGKRGGFRVIYYVRIETHIYLLFIYSKTDQDSVSDAEIAHEIDKVNWRINNPPNEEDKTDEA